jgi:hypothetical protein
MQLESRLNFYLKHGDQNFTNRKNLPKATTTTKKNRKKRRKQSTLFCMSTLAEFEGPCMKKNSVFFFGIED